MIQVEGSGMRAYRRVDMGPLAGAPDWGLSEFIGGVGLERLLQGGPYQPYYV